MKKLLMIFIFAWISFGGYSQTEKQDFSKDYYLQKSKKQRTVGWVILTTGAGIGIIGAIVSAEAMSEENWFFGDSKKSDTGLIIGGVGAATSLASIPFFLSARKNSRKAAQLSLESQRYFIPEHEFSGMQLADSLKSFSQTEKQNFSKDYYLQKSKKQRTTGWVLLGGGAAVGIAGLIVATDDLWDETDGLGTGLTLFSVGAASSLVSVPFFIIAGSNSRKAASLSMESQRYIIPGQELAGMQRGLSLKIELSNFKPDFKKKLL